MRTGNRADESHGQPEGYGYSGMLSAILRTEFPQLRAKVYADHAGATMYTQSQIAAVQKVRIVLHSAVRLCKLRNKQLCC